MTAATTPARHAALHARASAELSRRLSQYAGRFGWDAGQLAAHQRERLRELLGHAAEHSMPGGATPVAGWLRASINGRADEVFRFGDVAVHPHVIRSVLGSEAAIFEYQVRQTEGGIDVTCVTGSHLAKAALAARLEHALRQAGLSQPHVSIRPVETITRDPKTGKVSRFIPMRGHLAQPGHPARG